jgi:glutamyl-tRNA synthetase
MNVSNNNRAVRVRFAPSPTGHLHIGSLRTALFNWLFARHLNGTFLIRIEDTDLIRSTKEFENSLMQSLAWTGIDSDEPIMHQSTRFKIYQNVADQLITQGKAYKCFCTEDELSKKREKVVGNQDTYQYDKTCRNLSLDDQQSNKPFVIRFKVEISGDHFIFPDLIKGSVSIPSEQVDDFVLLRTDGIVTYNFAVVVDDIASNISHIIRGEEHLFNTPKQILLYQALNAIVPTFAHIPLILGPSGQKLSKRDGATSVVEYKKDGFLPQALCNYLVRLGWAHGDQEIFTQSEMIQHFALTGVHRSGAKFDIEKLKWVNSHYIKLLTPESIISLFTLNLEKDFVATTTDWTDAQRQAWITLYQDRAATLLQLYDHVVQAYFLPVSYDWPSLHQLIAKDVKGILQLLQQELTHVSFEKAELLTALKSFCKAHDYKMAEVSQLLRFVLIGSVSGPSVIEMMVLLGFKECEKRIAVVLAGL